MEVGLVGLPSVGKTCLLTALAGTSAAAGGGGAMKALVAVAQIPDPRLNKIAELVPTKKLTPASIRIVDIPGLTRGTSEGKGGAGQFLSAVREVDAICHVVRCFDDPSVAHVDETINPARDIDTIDTELVLADLVVVEGAIDKASRSARGNDADAKMRLAVLEKARPLLEEGQALRLNSSWSKEEAAVLRGYGLITAKPVLYVANVGENDLAGISTEARQVHDIAAKAGGIAVSLCAKLEGEIAELDEGDRQEMLNSLGLAEPAIGPLARALNSLLGLSVFYTAGEKEVRAWVIPIGAAAPEAAGAIHSDIQRGFIRAEIFAFDDLVQFKSEKAIKDAGKLRSEGKSYVMRDGDIAHFLFNVSK